jgi:hypothetical protein
MQVVNCLMVVCAEPQLPDLPSLLPQSESLMELAQSPTELPQLTFKLLTEGNAKF